MKKIEAFIRPEKLEDIKECLKSKHINGLSITQIMGIGNQKGWKRVIRWVEVEPEFNLLSKIKIEIVTMDAYVDEIVDCLIAYARTGEVGDGKIFISTIETAIRIRTNERDEDALK